MLLPGHMINETYRVEKLLGSGGMADVYVVAHMRLPRRFALKILRLEDQVREAFLVRFNREGEILATLRHPHIVDVIDRNQLPDGNPYLVMELLEGEDLATYLARTGALSIPVALRICSQIGDALDAAHKVGVVHRDLKPSNIFLSRQGHVLNFVKVLDFGIAKIAATERTPMTAPQALMGTPAYMSPEQARGQQSRIDTRTDQFALGTLLYEMLTGRGAFFDPGDAMYTILERVVTHHPAPLRDPQINRAVMRALAKTPEQRFPSLREFLAAVGATTHTVYSLPSLAKATPGTLSSQISERTLGNGRGVGRNLAIVGFGTGLLAGALGLFFSLRTPRTELATMLSTFRSSSTRNAAAKAQHEARSGTSTAAAQPIANSADNGSRSVETFIPIPEAPTHEAESNTDDDGSVQEQRPPSSNTNPIEASSPSEAEAKKQPAKQQVVVRPTLLPARRVITVGVKHSGLEAGIQACSREHLLPLRLVEGTGIKLERSGTLTVVDAPPVVFGTGFNTCLRQALAAFDVGMLPQTVSLRLVK